ncbi:MAG: glycosyltransferase [Pseudoflavonifractor sp.]|nr:glycosyltransferase [Pseudoflavonifractor sp.]
MSRTRVSVIITAYNKLRTIGRCLRSVSWQTGAEIEAIVVDDCSTDGTAALIDEWAGKVKVVRNDINLGHVKSRLAGIAVATGEYITFVDADDWLSRNAIANCLRHDADVVQMAVRMRVTALGLPIAMGNRYDSMMALDAQLYDERLFPVQCWGKLYRRRLIDDARFIAYDGFWGEDRLFNMAIFGQRPTVAVAKDAVYNYRWGGCTCHYRSEDLSEYLRVYGLKCRWLEDNGKRENLVGAVSDEMRRLARYDIRRMIDSGRYTREEAIDKIERTVCDGQIFEAGSAGRLYDENKPTMARRVRNIVKRVL